MPGFTVPSRTSRICSGKKYFINKYSLTMCCCKELLTAYATPAVLKSIFKPLIKRFPSVKESPVCAKDPAVASGAGEDELQEQEGEGGTREPAHHLLVVFPLPPSPTTDTELKNPRGAYAPFGAHSPQTLTNLLLRSRSHGTVSQASSNRCLATTHTYR